MSNDSRWVRAPDVLWRGGEFGVVVLAPSAGAPLTLDGTGPAVWEALARPHTRGELAAGLAARFGAPVARVVEDLGPVLERLAGVGVVREAPPSAAEPPEGHGTPERVGVPVSEADRTISAANAVRLVAAATGFGLPGAARLPAEPLDASAWRAVLDTSTRDRVTPLLAEAVAAGALAATAAQARAVTGAHERAMRDCVRLERVLLDTGARLEHAAVPYRVLKGPAVAHLDYPDPALRAFGDVDLLVTSSDYERALGVLTAAGAHRRFPETRPGFDRRFGKGACVVNPDGVQIDVHRTFVAGPFGLTVDLPELFRHDASVLLAGRSIPALDREGRFLHACFHAALGDAQPRLPALRDVAQLLLTTPLDLGSALERAHRWRAEAVVARAVRLAWDQLALEPSPVSRWAHDHRADPYQARALRAYTGTSRSYATQAAAGLAAVRGLPAKAAYVHALLVSEREHVARRDGGYGRRLQRAWRALRDARVTG